MKILFLLLLSIQVLVAQNGVEGCYIIDATFSPLRCYAIKLKTDSTFLYDNGSCIDAYNTGQGHYYVEQDTIFLVFEEVEMMVEQRLVGEDIPQLANVIVNHAQLELCNSGIKKFYYQEGQLCPVGETSSVCFYRKE